MWFPPFLTILLLGGSRTDDIQATVTGTVGMAAGWYGGSDIDWAVMLYAICICDRERCG